MVLPSAHFQQDEKASTELLRYDFWRERDCFCLRAATGLLTLSYIAVLVVLMVGPTLRTEQISKLRGLVHSFQELHLNYETYADSEVLSVTNRISFEVQSTFSSISQMNQSRAMKCQELIIEVVISCTLLLNFLKFKLKGKQKGRETPLSEKDHLKISEILQKLRKLQMQQGYYSSMN